MNDASPHLSTAPATDTPACSSRAQDQALVGYGLTAHRARLQAKSEKRGESDRGAQLAAERDAAIALARREAWRSSGIGSRYAVAGDAGMRLEWTQKRDALIRRLGSGMLVAIIGVPGTGKTHLAADVVRHHCNHAANPSAKYTRMMEIFMAMRACFRDRGESELSAAGAFIRPQLLVIDEAQERGESDWEQRIVTFIIDERYAQQRDTIIVSNFNPAGLKASLGPRIYSRMIETGGVVECTWASMRTAE